MEIGKKTYSFFVFFLFLLAFWSCKKEPEIAQINPIPEPTINSEPQIGYIRDGAYITMSVADSIASYYDYCVLDSNKKSFVGNFVNNSFSWIYNRASFEYFDCGTDSIVDSTTFINYFTIGSKDYRQFFNSNGVRIHILLDNCDYNTYVTSQSGSTFNIIDVRQEKVNGIQRVKILARFNCKVKLEGTNKIHSLTDGVLVAYINNK